MTEREGFAPLERVTTGVRGLDVCLGGGLLRGGVYLVEGPPGAGKTILGNQVAYHRAASGERALYVTLLAESHARMLGHLSGLSFFDPASLSRGVVYLSGYTALHAEGLTGLMATLRRELATHRAALLVVDGFLAAKGLIAPEHDLKRFVHELMAVCGLARTTAVLLASTGGGRRRLRPEHTMVDGLIELAERRVDARLERDLHVRKLRGTDHLRGRHTLRITDDGVVVHPRLESVARDDDPRSAHEGEPVSAGIDELDRMLHGGLPRGSSTLLMGPSGSGKTTFGLHYLSRAAAGEPGLFFGFYETPPRLLLKARRLGLELAPLVESGTVELLWQGAPEDPIDQVGERLLEAIHRLRPRRVFIDGLAGFVERAVFPDRVPAFLTAVMSELRACGATTVYTAEMRQLFGPELEAPTPNVSALAENLLLLRSVELRSRLYRIISILKVRDAVHDQALREFQIGPQGVSIASTFESAEAILTGQAHLQDAARERGGAKRAKTKTKGAKKAPPRRRRRS